jgi:hypothetical protein
MAQDPAQAPRREIVRCQIVWEGINRQSYHMTLDAVTAQQHTLQSEATDHPVEFGINLTDHIRPLGDQVSLRGIITDTPMLLPPDFVEGAKQVEVKIKAPVRTVGSTIVGRLAGPVTAATSRIPLPQAFQRKDGTALGFDPVFNRTLACWNALRKIRDDALLVQLVTRLHTYPSMALVSCQVSQEPRSGTSLLLALEFKQIRVARTDFVAIPAIPTTVREAGRKTVKPVTVEEPKQAESVTSKLFQ